MKREKPSTESLSDDADGRCGVEAVLCVLVRYPSPLDWGSTAQSGCQAFSGGKLACTAQPTSRVVCEYNPKKVVNSI